LSPWCALESPSPPNQSHPRATGPKTTPEATGRCLFICPQAPQQLQPSSGQAVAAVSFTLTPCTSPTPSPVPVTSSLAPHRCSSPANRQHRGAPTAVSTSPPHHLKKILFGAHDLPGPFPHPPPLRRQPPESRSATAVCHEVSPCSIPCFPSAYGPPAHG
jgi:hypothetical protein